MQESRNKLLPILRPNKTEGTIPTYDQIMPRSSLVSLQVNPPKNKFIEHVTDDLDKLSELF